MITLAVHTTNFPVLEIWLPVPGIGTTKSDIIINKMRDSAHYPRINYI